LKEESVRSHSVERTRFGREVVNLLQGRAENVGIAMKIIQDIQGSNISSMDFKIWGLSKIGKLYSGHISVREEIKTLNTMDTKILLAKDCLS
jgi:hypothetical protein